MSLFIIRSKIGASASRVRVANQQLAFLEKCDLRDTQEYLIAAQELRVAEAEAAIVQVEFLAALSAADSQDRLELANMSTETGFSVAA